MREHELLLTRTLHSGNKSLQNLKGQGSASRAGSQSSRVTYIEAASRVSDYESEDFMEIEGEDTIAYLHDDTAKPSVVIH